MKKIFLSIAVLSAIFFTSCTSEETDDPCNSISLEEASNLLDIRLQTFLAYDADPSPENCNAYKSALQQDVDFSKKLLNCTEDSTDKDLLEADIAELENEISELDC